MKIRITQPCAARLTFKPGDEIIVQGLTPELESLLRSERIDRQHVARVVHEGPEVQDPSADDELAVTTRGRRRSPAA